MTPENFFSWDHEMLIYPGWKILIFYVDNILSHVLGNIWKMRVIYGKVIW